MSQPVTLVNSLAKVFDPNTVRNQGPPASPRKPMGSPSTPPMPDGLRSIDLKLDGLAEKVDLLVSTQGRLLRSLEGAREKAGGVDGGDGPILCPDKPWRAEVTEVLAILRRESEKQSRRMEAMEKLMRTVEKVTGFLGETFRNSRIVQFLLTGRIGAKVKGEPASSGKQGLDLPETPSTPVGSEANSELQDKGEENTGQEHRDRVESPQDPDDQEYQSGLPPMASPTEGSSGQAEEREDIQGLTLSREKERITITVEVDPNGSHVPSEAKAEATDNCRLTLQSQRAATTGQQLVVTDAEPIRKALVKTLATVEETVKEIRRGKGRPAGETGEQPSGVGGAGTDLPLTGGTEPIDRSASGKSPIAGTMGSSGTGMGTEPSLTGKMKSSGTGMGTEASVTGKMESSRIGMEKKPSIAGKMGSSGTGMGKEPSITGKIGSSGTGMGKEPSIAGKMESSGIGMEKKPAVAGKMGSSGTVMGKGPSIAGKMGSSGTGMGKDPAIIGKMGSSGTGMGKEPAITGKMGSGGTGMGKDPAIAAKMGSSGTGMGKQPAIAAKIGSSGTRLDGKSPLSNGTDRSNCSPTQQLRAIANTGPVSREAWAASEFTAGPGGIQGPGARAESLTSLGGPASVEQGKQGTEPLTEGDTAQAGGPAGASRSWMPQGSAEDPNESEERPGEIQTGGHESGEQPSQPQEHPEQSLPIVDDSPSPPAPFEYRIVSAKHFIVTSFYAIDYSNLLGGGRFGQVYRCQEKSTGLNLAAKIIKTKGIRDKNEVKNEINVMNHLNHVNLIQLYDAFEARNNITLIMEYVEGGELFDRILERDGKMTELDAALVTRQICEGIQYMHGNYVLHLDLKPENIMCVNQSCNQIKIIDFGLARRYKPREKLKINFGTPEFIAPEVINYEFVSFPTDMWGVGVIVYMMVSGFSPFLGDDDTETMNNIIQCKWTFDDECFHGISDEAKDFIAGLLIRERSGRMTASECRKHPWLQGAEYLAQGLQVRLKSQVARRSLARRRWKKSQYAVIAANRFRALARLGRQAQAH